MKKEQDLYKLLEVPRDADTEQIRAAMLKLSKKYTMQGKVNAVTRAYFEEIKTAYQVLSSPYRRAAYDISLEEEELNQEESQRFLAQFFEKWKKRSVDSEIMPDITLEDTPPVKMKKVAVETYLQASWQNLNQKRARLRTLFRRHKHKVADQLDVIFMPGEVVKYQATIHWLLYMEIGALLLILIPGYFLLDVPDFVEGNTPTVSLWLVEKILQKMREFSIWNLGLFSLFSIGVLMWVEVVIVKQTTKLVITSKRIIVQFGLFNRRVIELKLTQFESITVDQSLLGRFFDYGTLTITGTSGVKISAPHVVAPLQFKQTLWYVLEQVNVQSFATDE